MKIKKKRIYIKKQDFQYLYDRLSHLLYIWENPKSVQAGFGPGETMENLQYDLIHLKNRYNLSDCYKHKAPEERDGIYNPSRWLLIKNTLYLLWLTLTNKYEADNAIKYMKKGYFPLTIYGKKWVN